ncbi:MAG TPA: SRPBCC family protein [Tardiphaga sp.]
MKITKEFVVSQSLPAVWRFFHDISDVAACLPGAQYLGPAEGGKHAGKVSSKIGPFQASFEGEADVAYDEEAKSVHVEGKGVDKKGASRGKMVMDCRLMPEGTATKVTVDADLQLSGTIAQFGRTGIITEIATIMVADFVRNAEVRLAARAAPATASAASASPAPAQPLPAAAPIGGITLLLSALKAWLMSPFRSRTN